MSDRLSLPAFATVPSSLAGLAFPLPPGVAQQWRHLPPAEGALTVPQRQKRQFDAGRAAAAALLQAAGALDGRVWRSADGAPCWPAGFVGSISHANDLVGVALAPSRQWRALGVDIEACLSADTAAEIRTLCFGEYELALPGWGALDQAARISAGFCAKEALYKALFPLTRRFFDFHEAAIVAVDPARLRLRLLTTLASQWPAGSELDVGLRWCGGHVLTALALPVGPDG